jgi:potassium-dependent mechanosensitive channel
MIKRAILLLIGMALLVAAQIAAVSPAAPATTVRGSTIQLSPDSIKAKIAGIEDNASLDKADKSALTATYQKALSYLESARSNEAAADAFMQAIKQAPIDTARLEKKIVEIRAMPEPDPSLLSKETLAELDQRLLSEKANLAAVEAKLADFEQQMEAERGRPAAARERLIELNRQQDELADAIKKLKAAGDSSPENNAKRWELEARTLALRSEMRMLDQELLSQSMRIALLTAERDKTAVSAGRLGLLVRQLEEAVNRRRGAAAEQTLAETAVAQRESAGKHPLVQDLAKKNSDLSDTLKRLTVLLDDASAGDDVANKQAKQIQKEFSSTREKLEFAGITVALGHILAAQRRALPDRHELEKKINQNEAMIANTSLAKIQNEEEKKRLNNIDAFVAELTAKLPPDPAETIRDDLRGLVRQRKELLKRTVATQKAYVRALGELDFAQRRLLEEVAAYDEFLSKRLLWLRSAPPPNLERLLAIPDQLAWLLSPAHWLDVTEVLVAQAKRSPLIGLAGALFAALLVMSRPMCRRLQALGHKVGNPVTDRFSYTLKALGLTLLLAMPWPMLLATLGRQLQSALEATEFSRLIGAGLLSIVLPYLNLRTLSVLCVSDGVAAAHFRWPEHSLKLVRHEIRLMMMLFLPAAFVAVVIIEHDAAEMGGGLGRFCFLLVMLSLGLFFFRLFHPKTGALVAFNTRHPDTLLARMNKLWLTLGVAVPVVLALLSILGFVYTAVILTASLIDSLWLLFGLVLIQQLGVRWLLLTRGKLAMQAAKERRAAQRARQEESAADGTPTDGVSMEEAEPEIDLASLNQESRKLLNIVVVVLGITGLWIIWSDVLPALGILDTIELWRYETMESGEQRTVAVTLADLCVAILIAVVTVVAAKRLPSLLEIILLRRVEMDSGSRYTATTLFNYVIVAIGIVLFFKKLGGSWSQIQWLVAALGVGIGFGLQEIVANFISGLIILFERPIRVGDVVTIGDTDGTVTRIRIRATTIRNWDRQELLVPNKEFITGRLLNWSLSDQVTRLLIPVGVAYGSDVARTKSLLADAAEENERVLTDPAPTVTFDGFGDNALALSLRCYVELIDYRLSTITALNEAINQKFTDAGICIAFPQRDVHLDFRQPLDVRIQRKPPAPGGK